MRTILFGLLATVALSAMSAPVHAATDDKITDAEAAALAKRVKAETKHA